MTFGDIHPPLLLVSSAFSVTVNNHVAAPGLNEDSLKDFVVVAWRPNAAKSCLNLDLRSWPEKGHSFSWVVRSDNLFPKFSGCHHCLSWRIGVEQLFKARQNLNSLSQFSEGLVHANSPPGELQSERWMENWPDRSQRERWMRMRVSEGQKSKMPEGQGQCDDSQ